MADLDITVGHSFVDKRKGRGATAASPLTEQANYDNIADMKTRLSAINAGYFTAARLNAMTKNDLVFALRTAQDSAGIK